MKLERIFTSPDQTMSQVLRNVEQDVQDVKLEDANGSVVFQQNNVAAPKSWSDRAVLIAASKYFFGALDSGERERSVLDVVTRIVETITAWGKESGVLSSENAETFAAELAYLLINQYGAFNSPVFFNCGVKDNPQVSACFITSVEDTMDSILDLAKIEGNIFKGGSGVGVNLSPLRSSYEGLTGGGQASGPISFMRGFDAFAGAIKSGGRTRRAAKMIILNVGHPDILELADGTPGFIWCKAQEEQRAQKLIAAGYSAAFNKPGNAYEGVFFQNANHSVSVPDAFMKAVQTNADWYTEEVTTGRRVHTYKASRILSCISEATHQCGDPALFFETEVNRWNTTPRMGDIVSANPCAEFLHPNNTACNLASLNLLKFVDGDRFNFDTFEASVKIFTTAQEILVDRASYPTSQIAETTKSCRPLGLGYANLGGLLMALGLAYDSEEGRRLAAEVTSSMTVAAYAQSAEVAKACGPCAAYDSEASLRILGQHMKAAKYFRTQAQWQALIEKVKKHGLRNSAVTSIAPTGTIGLMMDCDTTGIEPSISLRTTKNLVGGGSMTVANRLLPRALKSLNYDTQEVTSIMLFLEKHQTLEGSPIRPEHLPVFDCSLPWGNSARRIRPQGHIAMVSAIQPHLSMGVSKTVNVDKSTSAQEIMQLYVDAWKSKLKAISIYRDGCKASQPLQTATPLSPEKPRRKLPPERQSITHKFVISNHEGYITAGLHDDGSLGEVFVLMSKEGSTARGLMDSFATLLSITLQHDVPLDLLVEKFVHTRFEPNGYTGNPKIRTTSSIIDYLFKWLALKFCTPIASPADDLDVDVEHTKEDEVSVCYKCGGGTIFVGVCQYCIVCGSSQGGCG